MSEEKKNKGHDKKKESKFPSKKVKHDPQDESARAIFGKQDNERT
jgi:hypothetical protein